MNNSINYLALLFSELLGIDVAIARTQQRVSRPSFSLTLRNRAIISIGCFGLLKTDSLKIAEILSCSDITQELYNPVLNTCRNETLTIYNIFKKADGRYLGEIAADFNGNIPDVKYQNMLPTLVSLNLTALIDKSGISRHSEINVTEFILRANFVRPVKQHYLKRKRRKFIIHKEEMEGRICLNIKIGVLEMQLSDFLNLQEGDEVELKNFTPTQILFDLDGSAWAQGEVTYNEEGVKIKVIRIIEANKNAFA